MYARLTQLRPSHDFRHCSARFPERSNLLNPVSCQLTLSTKPYAPLSRPDDSVVHGMSHHDGWRKVSVKLRASAALFRCSVCCAGRGMKHSYGVRD
jgi:hypothetical protein